MSTLAAGPADSPEAGDHAAIESEIQQLEVRHIAVLKNDTKYRHEMNEMTAAGLSVDEEIERLRARLAAVTGELGEHQLTKKAAGGSAGATGRFAASGGESKEDSQLVSYNSVAGLINTAYRQALQSRLRDPLFVNALAKRGGALIVHCRVHWGEEAIDWKVYDDTDGTERTVGALLQDVARYWGLRYIDVALQGSDGAVWLLEGYVHDELRQSRSKEANLVFRPGVVATAEELAIEYTQDDRLLSSTEKRKRDRKRRERLEELHSKLSAESENLRFRAELVSEMIKYCFFLGLFFFCLYGRRSVLQGFYLLNALQTVFVDENFGDANEKTFMDIATFDEFYEWAQGPFTFGLLPPEFYDGSPISGQDQKISYYNKIVGGVRLRQCRIDPGTLSEPKGCTIGLSVQEVNTPGSGPTAGEKRKRAFVDFCYHSYDELVTRSTKAYSAGSAPPDSDLAKAPQATAFRWVSAEANDLPGVYEPGQYGLYDGSGFVLDITNLTTSYLIESFDFLMENQWLDYQTRALYISFVVYNANFNLYAVMQLVLELSPGGVFTPKYTLRSMKMDLYDNISDLVSLVFEGLLYLLLLLYVSNEFRELYDTVKATGSVREYINFYNFLDWSVVFFSFLALGYRLQFFMTKVVRNFSPFSETYVELSDAAKYYNLSFSIDSIAAFFITLRAFRYFRLQRNLWILRTAIERSIQDLAIFFGMMILVMVGFAFAGKQIFGQEVEVYVTEWRAFQTIFLILLGEFDYDSMKRVQPMAALLYFFVYLAFVFFVMVNIFLAILNDAYIAVCEDFAAAGVEYTGEDLTFRQRMGRLRDWFRTKQMEKRMDKMRKNARKLAVSARRVAITQEKESGKRSKHQEMMSVANARAAAAGSDANGDAERGASKSKTPEKGNGKATEVKWQDELGADEPLDAAPTVRLLDSIFGSELEDP